MLYGVILVSIVGPNSYVSTEDIRIFVVPFLLNVYCTVQ